MMRGGSGSGGGSFGGQQRSKVSNRDIILRWEKAFLTKLFQINHVLLSNQAVTVPLFHLILVLSFIQILFNIFYKVDVYDEFNITSTLAGSSTLLNSTMSLVSSNASAATNVTGAVVDVASTSATTMIKAYRIDQLFIFINFHIYVMQGATSPD